MNRTSLRTLVKAEWDRIAAYLLIAAGATLIVVAWLGVSDTPFVADQLSYIASGGVGGLFLLALGLALLMSADHHDEWRKLDAIQDALRGQSPEPRLPTRPEDAVPAGRPEGRARGLTGLSVGTVVSAVIVIVGWAHSSGSGRQGVAAEGLTLSLTGLLLVVAAVAAFLMPSRQRLAARRAHLLRHFILADAAADVPSDVVLVAPGLSRYHRPGCPALNGVPATRTALRSVDAGLQPCDLCHWGEER